MSALQEKVVDAYVAWDAVDDVALTGVDDDGLSELLDSAIAADEAIAADPIEDLIDALLAVQYATSMLSRWEASSRDEEIMRAIMGRVVEFLEPTPAQQAA